MWVGAGYSEAANVLLGLLVNPLVIYIVTLQILSRDISIKNDQNEHQHYR
jgi:hypothetical protein